MSSKQPKEWPDFLGYILVAVFCFALVALFWVGKIFFAGLNQLTGR